MYEEELRQIKEASEKNALTFFVGAGVSKLSKAPSWAELVDEFSSRLGMSKKGMYSADELLQIPQMYWSKYNNEDEYYAIVQNKLNYSSIKPNIIHSRMLELNPVSFLTTNYDPLIEEAAIMASKSYKVISSNDDVPNIFGDRFILKVHGDIEHRNIVLKEDDYLNYSDDFKLIETLMKSIFATNTVVFIGYGLNDYNIKLVLNWTKTLLGGKFRKPIFIRTEDKVLKAEELGYQQNRGLRVVDCKRFIRGDKTKLSIYRASTIEDQFLMLYKSVFDAIDKESIDYLEGITIERAFDNLYMRLKPLDEMNALRLKDVYKKLQNHVIIGREGKIYSSGEDCILLKRFYQIHQMPKSRRRKLKANEIEKYETILSVFKKARIRQVNSPQEYLYKRNEAPFADQWCILFNYVEMGKYASKKMTSDIYEQYRKAFYLSCLRRYEEALFVFSDVSADAYNSHNYLLYYLAKSNCISLSQYLKNLTNSFKVYDSQIIEQYAPSEIEKDKLFYLLPVEFRNEHAELKDIYDASMLYEYSYAALSDVLKVQTAIESGTIEWGLTSSDKVFLRINEYLHFLLGNGIIASIFDEYRNAVKNLLSSLIYKYSTQNKKLLHEQVFPFEQNEIIIFDETSFYCFVDCFDAKDIKSLLLKHSVETINFNNMDLIEQAVNNILSYYEYALKTKRHPVEIFRLETQIKSLVCLLGYMNISQELVDGVISFVLSHEFRQISFVDKREFLIRQLYQRKMFSDVTDKCVEDTLIGLIDLHIRKMQNKENSNIAIPNNYEDLIHLISPKEKEFVSRKLSNRVAVIMENGLASMYDDIAWKYCDHITAPQKERLIDWATNTIIANFRFDLFAILIHCHTNINDSIKQQSKEYLWEIINKAREKKNEPEITIPINNPYDDLDQVGLWCFNKMLNKEDYSEFLGNSALFDFFYEQENYDFSRFDVSWLFRFYRINRKLLISISENDVVKKNIREIAAARLKLGKVDENDKHILQDILVQYFC